MLRWRYEHRFDNPALEMRSEAEEVERRRNPLLEEPDPDFDPSPQASGWVIITPDKRGAGIAAEVLPEHGFTRSDAFLFAIGVGILEYMRDEPSPRRGTTSGIELRTWISEYPRTFATNRDVEALLMVNKSKGLDPPVSTAMRRLSYLRGVLATRIFHLVEDFSGATELQLAIFTGDNARRIKAALAQLVRGGLLIRYPVYRLPDGELTSDGEVWKARIAQLLPDQAGQEPEPVFHMHYLSDEGTIIVAHRDQSSLARIRRRVREDMRKDHAGDCSQLLHTLQLNDCVAALTAAGYAVCAG